MKGLVIIAALICAAASAAAQNGAGPPVKPIKTAHSPARSARPLPVVIPQQFAPPQEVYASLPDASTAMAQATASECQVRLAKFAVFQPIPVLVGPGECGAVDAVRMDEIIMPDQSKVAVTPPAILRCPMADELVRWVREDVVPVVGKLGSPLRVLDNFDSYECRGRNRIRAATLSEHGEADAIDVRAFKLADGRAIGLTDINVEKELRESLRTSACARFSTVLGPGSDGYHEEHIHLDLASRRNGYKLCQWQVREPAVAQTDDEAKTDQETEGDQAAPIPLDMVPLPRPRPVAQIERALSRARITPQ